MENSYTLKNLIQDLSTATFAKNPLWNNLVYAFID